MLIIQCNSISQESRYIYGVLFGEFLGLDWRFEQHPIDEVRITFEGQKGEILLPNIFLPAATKQWLNPMDMPKLPLEKWDTRELGTDIILVEPVVPVIYGDLKKKKQHDEESICLPIDIFGSAFFMLSRYEEAINLKVDKHNRFPAIASLAVAADFLNRPIIDEYTEILWAAIYKLWPSLKRKEKSGKIRVTCDVDSCYDVDFSAKAMLRGLIADILKRRNFQLALKNLNMRIKAKKGVFGERSHFNNICWMMDVNEASGNRVVFYFMVNKNKQDANYNIDEPRVRELMHEIGKRGHEIGLHPSYETYLDREKTENEVRLLKRVLEADGKTVTELGARQHFLRWKTPETARNLEFSQIRHDSTLGYADRSGFRCGTSREFSMYDLLDRQTLKMKQRPLIIMETTVASPEYLGLGYTEKALEYIEMYKQRALKIGGEFTFLWHNSSFENDYAYLMYESLIKNN